jgi:hypothetical protein
MSRFGISNSGQRVGDTIRKRLQAKLNEVKTELRRRMHDPIPEVGRWLGHIRSQSPALQRKDGSRCSGKRDME